MTGSSSAPWRPLGLALRDFAGGNHDASVEVWRDEREDASLPASLFFRSYEELSPAEEVALALCTGRVLDVGASAGPHALALEAEGGSVVAIDVCPLAVEVMRARGVHDARVADIATFEDEVGFDTVLLLMNGIGIVGTLAGFDAFLDRIARLLRPNGQILFDSTDLLCSPDPDVVEAARARAAAGAYAGEVTYRLRYGGETGAPYGWLYLDPDTMRAHARARGFFDQILFEDEDRQYVARLTRVAEAGTLSRRA